MASLHGKSIVLGISGGIAAYKSAELTRLLVKAGARVRVCMTRGAQAFITPLTLQALSGNPVHTSLLDPEAEAGMGHIELARWADLILIAPASADLLARLSAGMADDLLSTLCLASAAPLAVAPAMNQQMWQHPATQASIRTLQARGTLMLGPAQGEQACGDVGPGRMLEPAELLAAVAAHYSRPQPLTGVHVLVTAGPTREALDPVRFLSNRSSGKMGYAVAAAAHALGARVTLVSGPVSLEVPAGVTRVAVESAQQMLEAARSQAVDADMFIATAAVADYTPKATAAHKIKKSSGTLELVLTRTTDILATLSTEKPELFCVGFAAETRNLLEYARDKLKRKRIHMIAANLVADGKAFDQDHNALEVVWADGAATLPDMSKQELARALMALVVERFTGWKAAQAVREVKA
ncbi:MAG TPA: bifunctional phosphopantothenoylcysteine decarboxylase/phosphopantothenate--cysteine ligase CoaBC [Thiolinea sp.]|nr:bifunctional phosphopantothenoylcysteine decarboxylase/phosphopantothenate--cysteine ligase CoaBC [Thiolinea sp.]